MGELPLLRHDNRRAAGAVCIIHNQLLVSSLIFQDVVGPAARLFGVFCVFCGSQIISVIRVFCGFFSIRQPRSLRSLASDYEYVALRAIAACFKL